ncbi:MAG: ABC transporter ATP-binding protein [Nitrospinota bacterium]
MSQKTTRPLLEVRGLTKRFGGLVAVRDLSLSVEAGEVLGIVGPNGAGKTTLFEVISGFQPPSSGEVRLEARRLNGLRPDERCRLGIGRTFQLEKTFRRLTIRENVMMGAFARQKDARRARKLADQVLEEVGLSAKADLTAGGLTPMERKRLEIGRAVATQPKVMLLDECMAGLRPGEVDESVDLIRRLNRERGMTFLVIEHVMRAVMSLSGRILVMHHGERIALGKPEDVVRDALVVEAFLGEAPIAHD